MADEDLGLIAHLLRRAGFGASREELEAYAAKGYDEVVEDLVDEERCPPIDEDIIKRYFGGQWPDFQSGAWIYRMLNSPRPLEEKMALFCHHVFATGFAKVAHALAMNDQIDLFRRIGLSNFREILLELSMNPAMINWLDNNENIKGEPNENYGRELLELFSMGVGNYTEDDIKNCALAFTGWTYAQPVPSTPTATTLPNSSSARRTTTTARRPSSATPATSTATTSSISSSSSRPPPASSPATSTTSSSPTSPRSPPGM